MDVQHLKTHTKNYFIQIELVCSIAILIMMKLLFVLFCFVLSMYGNSNEIIFIRISNRIFCVLGVDCQQIKKKEMKILVFIVIDLI